MRRRVATLAAVIVAIAYCAVVPWSRAEIVADAGSGNGISLCGMLYSKPGLDPSGLWGRLNSKNTPPIKIILTKVPTDGTGTKTSVDDDGIEIHWDPTHDITVDDLTSSPCEALYHELQHAADDADKVARSELDETCNGIPKAEWRAVAAQNAYRKALGLPGQRDNYHGKKFGSSSFEECKKNQPTKPGTKPTNSVFGDPHLTTTDGLLYDLQQVGEFTAFTSDDSDAPRVQVRTTPVGESTVAALVSGVAAGSGDDRIAFIATDGALAITKGDGKTVTVDDADERDLGAGMVLISGASADLNGRAYTVHWDDGSQLQVDGGGYWGLRMSFTPSAAAVAAQPKGLLGNFNGDPADDLIRPDGRAVAGDSSAATIRSDFGDAWRITQADSLFPYFDNESTETFTDLTFPSGEPELPTEVTDQARTVCEEAGITDAGLLAACVLDVGVTGNPALAETAAAVAREVTVNAVAVAPTAGQPVMGTDFGAGLAVSGTVSSDQTVDYEFTAQAGDVADIRSRCTRSGKSFTYSVAAVDGSLAEPVGFYDGCADLGRVAFGTDGTYRLVVVGKGAGDGQYAISWRETTGDESRPLSVGRENSGHLVAATRHSLDFAATAGQQWSFSPEAGCRQVRGFTWAVLNADGGLDGRGVFDACQPIGPLTLTPGVYSVQISAAGIDADYRFTAASS